MDLTRDPNQRKLGLILAFGALLWSGSYNALAKGLTPFLSPMTLLILSEALTGLFIVLTFGVIPLCRKLMEMDAKSIRMAVIVGLLNSAVGPLLWFTGLARTSAINASLLSCTDVVCVILFGWIILRERVTRMQLTGVLTIVLGIVVVNVVPTGEGMTVHSGDAFILLGTFAFGAGSILFKRYLSHVMPELAIVIRNVAGIVAVAFVSLFLQYSFVDEVKAFPLEKVLLLLSFAFFARYLYLTFFYESLDRLPTTTFSFIQIATPLSGLVFAFLILGEQVQSYQMLGAMLIVVGLATEQLSGRTIRKIHDGFFHAHLWFLRRSAEPSPMPVLMPRHV